jgi:phosphoglycolate phosphatase
MIILFDLDGTLIDSTEAILESFSVAYKTFEAEVPADTKHATLGVVTTKTAKYSIELLEHMGLMGYFEVLIGREDVENPKPHPEPVYKALSKLQSDTTKCWMVGDTCMDMHAAKAAGIESIAVTCGYGTKEVLGQCTENVHKNALEAITFITSD